MLYIQIFKFKLPELFGYVPELRNQIVEDEHGNFFILSKKSIGYYSFMCSFVQFAIDIENFGFLINKTNVKLTQEFKEKILFDVLAHNY